MFVCVSSFLFLLLDIAAQMFRVLFFPYLKQLIRLRVLLCGFYF